MPSEKNPIQKKPPCNFPHDFICIISLQLQNPEMEKIFMARVRVSLGKEVSVTTKGNPVGELCCDAIVVYLTALWLHKFTQATP